MRCKLFKRKPPPVYTHVHTGEALTLANFTTNGLVAHSSWLAGFNGGITRNLGYQPPINSTTGTSPGA
jgi:hypothetical protein